MGRRTEVSEAAPLTADDHILLLRARAARLGVEIPDSMAQTAGEILATRKRRVGRRGPKKAAQHKKK